MKSLHDMTIGERIALTVVIVLVIIFALAFIGWVSGGWDQPAAAEHVPLYQGIPLDAKLLPLDKRAFDEAYHNHLVLLFSVWVKDQAGDSSRINTGLRIARRAYHEALQQIEKRERQLEQER